MSELEQPKPILPADDAPKGKACYLSMRQRPVLVPVAAGRLATPNGQQNLILINTAAPCLGSNCTAWDMTRQTCRNIPSFGTITHEGQNVDTAVYLNGKINEQLKLILTLEKRVAELEGK